MLKYRLRSGVVGIKWCATMVDGIGGILTDESTREFPRTDMNVAAAVVVVEIV